MPIKDTYCKPLEETPFGTWCDPLDITYKTKSGEILIYRGDNVRKIIGSNYARLAIAFMPNENDGFYIKWPHPKKKRLMLIHKIYFSQMEKL